MTSPNGILRSSAAESVKDGVGNGRQTRACVPTLVAIDGVCRRHDRRNFMP